MGVAEKRIERLTHCHVLRPGTASVAAVGVKQLRIRIIYGVSRVEPDHIDASIWSHRKGAKPMPFGWICGIIIDSDRRTKALSAVSASNKHDIGRSSPSYGADTSQHVHIVVRARPGPIDREEHLAGQSGRIDDVAHTYKATKIDSGALVERRSDRTVLCVNRSKAPNLAGS